MFWTELCWASACRVATSNKKTNKSGLYFSHKTVFCCIQQPARSENDGFYVIHLMMEYRRDVQSLCMKSSSDTHIQRWAEAFGAVPDNRLRNDFYRIQQEIASIIMKDVLEENGMFYGGPISRADVRTRIALQRQDMTPFTKLGCMMTHKYRGSIIVLSISKSVEPNEE